MWKVLKYTALYKYYSSVKTTMAKVIEEFLHFLAKRVCAKEGGRAPFCKSLVAVLVTEGWNCAGAGLGVQVGSPGCCDWC